MTITAAVSVACSSTADASTLAAALQADGWYTYVDERSDAESEPLGNGWYRHAPAGPVPTIATNGTTVTVSGANSLITVASVAEMVDAVTLSGPATVTAASLVT